VAVVVSVWEDNCGMDSREVRCEDVVKIQLARKRNYWRVLMKAVLSLPVR
jgi:hypothetical protein